MPDCDYYEDEVYDENGNPEPPCLICAGEQIVDGSDHLDWDEDGYDQMIACPSCKGTGLAKDMTYC